MGAGKGNSQCAVSCVEFIFSDFCGVFSLKWCIFRFEKLKGVALKHGRLLKSKIYKPHAEVTEVTLRTSERDAE